MNNSRSIRTRTWDESKKMWEIAAPAILTSVAQFSLGFATYAFMDNLGEFELAAVSIVQNVLEGFVYGIMIVYVVSGFFPESWTGLSMKAFKSLVGFVKLSLASAVMLCLELWYFTLVILMVGWLKNPEIAVDAMSICMNLEIWTLMVTCGFSVAISVRVSNELGANNPKAAKFFVLITVLTSIILGIVSAIVVIATKDIFPRFFTSKEEVTKETSKLGYFLAATMVINGIQPVLHGVAVGAGWQVFVAQVNFGCYYLFGLSSGALLGYKFDQGVRGIWIGMLVGCVLQTVILVIYVVRANWSAEALKAEKRVRSCAS